MNIQEVKRSIKSLKECLPLKTITTDQEYDNAVNALNELLDAGGADENNDLAVAVCWVSDFIAEYECGKK